MQPIVFSDDERTDLQTALQTAVTSLATRLQIARKEDRRAEYQQQIDRWNKLFRRITIGQ